MRRLGPVAALLTVGLLMVLHSSSSEAQQFYTGSGNNMFRVFACAPNTTPNVSGTGSSQQGDRTIHPGNVVAAGHRAEMKLDGQVRSNFPCKCRPRRFGGAAMRGGLGPDYRSWC